MVGLCRPRPGSGGVVGAGFDPTGADEAYASQQAWVVDRANGLLWHAGRASYWEGQPADIPRGLKEGDVVVSAPSRRV